jgi:CubicO group peptidase (beta-lactamase class C family)
LSEAGGPVADLLRAEIARAALPGASWWVEARGRVRDAGAVGMASLEPQPSPATEHTVYDLASLTKPLCTALLAAMLEQEGALSLEAPVEEALPSLSGTALGSRTLLDLGSHRAGLPPWRPLYLQGTTAHDYLRSIVALPSTPGPPVVYSDLGYLVLGWAVERAAKENLDGLFDTRIAVPLGLRRTGFAVAGRFADAAPTERGNDYEKSMAGPEGEGYTWRRDLIRGEAHDENAHALGGVAGHAGLFGMASEVAAIAREMLRPERLPLGDRALRRLLREPHPGLGRTFGFVTAGASGAGRGVLPPLAPGHTGFTGTSLWLDPDEDALFVLLSNRVHPVVRDVDFQTVRAAFHEVAARA